MLDKLVGRAGVGPAGAAAGGGVAASGLLIDPDGGGEFAEPEPSLVVLDGLLGLPPTAYPPCLAAPTAAARAIAAELIVARTL